MRIIDSFQKEVETFWQMQIMKLLRARIDHPALLCVTQTIFTIFKQAQCLSSSMGGLFYNVKGR